MGNLPPVFVVDGARTPFLKSRNLPGAFSASELALQATRPLLQRLSIMPTAIDEVIMGCVMPSPDEANIARVLALRLGCDVQTPAWTVQRNCASGMQALDCACKDIQLGRADLVLAGGCEAMSRAPLLWKTELVAWLGRWQRARSLMARMRLLAALRPAMLLPVISLLRGLRDPLIGLTMGSTAELLAERFAISRQQMDSFAVRSHQRLAAAVEQHHLSEEIVPLFTDDGQLLTADDGLRADSTLEKLATLNPVFEPPYGLVTAGNSSQVSDGAAVLLLASETAVERDRLPVLGRIAGCAWAALEPELMGLGPVSASNQLLAHMQLRHQDVDYWEINEAFAAQVLACLAQWQQQMDWMPDEQRLNADGGAIAMGHPVGATGARLVLHTLRVLQREQWQRGIATLCIGGGQGGSMMVVRDA